MPRAVHGAAMFAGPLPFVRENTNVECAGPQRNKPSWLARVISQSKRDNAPVAKLPQGAIKHGLVIDAFDRVDRPDARRGSRRRVLGTLKTVDIEGFIPYKRTAKLP